MTTYINSVRHFFEAYKVWVAQNPQTVTDVETTAKWVSYFVAGRISNSSVATELIYSLSNLLVLFNDRIIEKSQETHTIIEKSAYRLKVILTTIEYCEVLLENSARKLFGNKGRWILIVAVQTIKTIGRYLLLRKYSETVICSPPIQQLNRKTIERENQADHANKDILNGTNKVSFKLKRSGRVIRKVEGAPPLQFRNWQQILENDETPKDNAAILLKAEAIYVAKPLLHLLSMGVFGRKSWRSYSVSLALDLISLRTYHKNRHLMTKEQRVQLSRRCVCLLLFLVRSPFYESVSKSRIENLLQSLGLRIPFAKTICKPLIEYIPQWQDTYFYMWST